MLLWYTPSSSVCWLPFLQTECWCLGCSWCRLCFCTDSCRLVGGDLQVQLFGEEVFTSHCDWSSAPCCLCQLDAQLFMLSYCVSSRAYHMPTLSTASIFYSITAQHSSSWHWVNLEVQEHLLMVRCRSVSILGIVLAVASQVEKQVLDIKIPWAQSEATVGQECSCKLAACQAINMAAVPAFAFRLL